MKLLLIRETSEIRGEISHGIGLIGTIAQEVATVRIIDNNSLYVTHSTEKLMEKILEFSPDIIGFHVYTHNLLQTGILVQHIKRTQPHLGLIGGGIHAFYEPGEILDLGIHIVAVEEADLTIIPLLNALQEWTGLDQPFQINAALTEQLQKIPGLLFDTAQAERISTGRPDFITDLNQLPFVDFSMFNLSDYIHKPEDGRHVTNTLLTQRGCPFSCTFCQGDEQHGAYRMTRVNSPHYRLAYMRHLNEKYHHNHFIFYDANFTLNRQKTMEFCELIQASELHGKITFYCETNAFSVIDADMAATLRQAGCVDMGLGIERLTEPALLQINKRLKLNIIHECIRNLSHAGIRISANALLGFPFDTAATIQAEEHQFMQLLNQVDSIMVSVVVPLPGTKIYQQTRYKQWYLQSDYGQWKPPFYHLAYNYNGNAWHANYFDLNDQTMTAIRSMREHMHEQRIQRVNSRVVSLLFFFVKRLAKTSWLLFRWSPRLERILFMPVMLTYTRLWKGMVGQFYVTRPVKKRS